MFPAIIIMMVLISGFFDGVKKESVENAIDVKITFQLPKSDDAPMDYIITDIPYEFETPNSKYNKTAWKLPVQFQDINGEIYVSDSLKFQIAVAMKNLGMDYSEKNLKKLIGHEIKIWMAKGTDDNNYYHCQISESNLESE